MTRAPFLLPLAGLALFACQDQRAPTAPPGDRPVADIQDGYSTNPQGNQHFFFLAPIRPLALQPPKTAPFNPNLSPVVRICEVGGTTCFPDLTMALGRPSLDDFPRSIFDKVFVIPKFEAYAALWNTFGKVGAGKVYRIQVLVGETALGFADAKVVTTKQELLAVDRTKFVPLLKDFPLLIAFRIEQGAVCFGQTDCVEQTVGPSPVEQHVVVENPGGVRPAAVSFPPNYFNQTVTVTIHRVAVPCLNTSYQQFDSCYSFSTNPRVENILGCPADPTNQAKCARVEVCPPLTPDNRSLHVELFRSDPPKPAEPVPGATAAFILCQSNIGMGPKGVIDLVSARWRRLVIAASRLLTPQPAFAATSVIDEGLGGLVPGFSNIGWALRVTIAKFGGDNQTAVSGTKVLVNPSAMVNCVHPDADHAKPGVPPCPIPLAGVQVTFARSGAGSVGASPAPTNSDGVASTSWTLSPTDGLNTLTASALGSSVVSFSATGMTIKTDVVDLTNDAVIDTRVATSPELVNGTATAGGGNLMLSVRFAAETFNSVTTLVQFVLDTDRDPHTGSPGVDASGENDPDIMSMDYIVEIDGTQARVLRYTGTLNHFTLAGTAPVTVAPNGLDTAIPLSLLGNNDGQMNFKVVTFSQISGGFTGVLDYMPNVGLAPGMLQLPAPPSP